MTAGFFRFEAQHRAALKSLTEHGLHGNARPGLVAEAYFQFVGVDVDIDAGWRQRKMQRAHWVHADGDAFAANALQRLRKQRTAHGAAIDEKSLMCARGLGLFPHADQPRMRMLPS